GEVVGVLPGLVVEILAVVYDGWAVDFSWFRLQAADREVGLDREEGSHPILGDGPAVAGASRIGLDGRPAIPAEAGVVVRGIEVELQRMPDRPTRHELAEADRPAERGEARAAMGTGLTGPVQILGPEHVVGRRRLAGPSGEG